MFSVVCVYNNDSILNNFLLKGLNDQNAEFELITVNNIDNKYSSAAKALNFGARNARGKYIMFVHQDVKLTSSLWLKNAEEMIDTLPSMGIAGVAGVAEENDIDGIRGRNIIQHGDPPHNTAAKPITDPEIVQTLDECLFIIPKDIFKDLHFDEETCDDWHLYGTDYCLAVRKLNLSAYVLPLSVYHRSSGDSMSGAYYVTLKRLLKKYRMHEDYIYKPGFSWSTSAPLALQRIYFWLKRFLINFLIKIGLRYIWRKSGLKNLWIKYRKRSLV